jgi:beta-1,4-mannosyltransferase
MSGINSAAILVLGDLNRSPRMLNHAKAISQNFSMIKEINLIGFQGGDLRSDIANDPKIKVQYIPEKINNYLKKLPRFLFLLSALIRIFLQFFYLFYILLFKISKPQFLILQNPPGIPAIYICSVICFLRRTKFIIDWHNYGYTILEVNGRNKLICQVAKFYEKIYGKCADLHFCVSEAMKKHLKNQFNIDAINLPDRAIKNVFKKLNLDESHLLFQKYEITKNKMTIIDSSGKVGLFTNRPILMLSSTSWTPDEDFNLLLDSFVLTENTLMNDIQSLRKVLFIITGRGPNKEDFFKKLSEKNLKLFDVKSIWLESDDYPKLLGTADLGVCLHYSSSGFDLPMKVVDMFAAQLPVASYYYDTIIELVQQGKNGFFFSNKKELSKIFIDLIKEFSKEGGSKLIDSYSENLKEFGNYDWVSQWGKIAMPPIIKKTKLKLNIA